MGPEKGHRNDKKAGALQPVKRQAEGDGTVQPAEEKVLGRGHLIVAFQYLKGTARKVRTPFLAGSFAVGQGIKVFNYKNVDVG